MADQDVPMQFSELIDAFKDDIDLFKALFQLKTDNAEEINSFYKDIKTKLLESKKYHPQFIIDYISIIYEYNVGSVKAYLQLAKLIYDDYHPTCVANFVYAFHFLFYKVYGIFIKCFNLGYFGYYNKDHYPSNAILEENPIYRAIVSDDIKSFILFTEMEDFDKNQMFIYSLYPNYAQVYSLLELCCYNGSVNCFKLLRTKFKSNITEKCLQYSFLGGNQEIMSECLKYQEPDEECMKYAIISHNIDFVTFLMNEFNIEIKMDDCVKYHNVLAFLVYLDQTHKFDECLLYSPVFNDVKLCQYLISQGADIYAQDKERKTVLHYAAINNSNRIIDLLISQGANIDAKDKKGKTPLHYAAINNSKETAELLILYGADINAVAEYGRNSLHCAVEYNSREVAELLILHGLSVHKKDSFGSTLLDFVFAYNCKDSAEVLFLHGVKSDEKFYLRSAALYNTKEIAELLISHGSDVNEKDEEGKTALHYAAINNKIETAKILISYGADLDAKDNEGKTALY